MGKRAEIINGLDYIIKTNSELEVRVAVLNILKRLNANKISVDEAVIWYELLKDALYTDMFFNIDE